MDVKELTQICNDLFGARGTGSTIAIGFAHGNLYYAKQKSDLPKPVFIYQRTDEDRGVIVLKKFINSREYLPYGRASGTSIHAEMMIVRCWMNKILEIPADKKLDKEYVVAHFNARMGLVIAANAPCCKHCDNMLSLLRIAHPTSDTAAEKASTFHSEREATYEPSKAQATGSSDPHGSSATTAASSPPAASSTSAPPATSRQATKASVAMNQEAAAASSSPVAPPIFTDKDSIAMKVHEDTNWLAAYRNLAPSNWSASRPGNTGWWNPITDAVIPHGDPAFTEPIPWMTRNSA